MRYAQSDCIQIYVLILGLDKALAPQLQVLTSRIDEEQAPAPGFSVTQLARMGSLNIDFCCLKPRRIVRLSTTSMGKLVLGIFGAVAEFETDIRKERQRDGIEKAKLRGVYKGRPASIDPQKIRELSAAGMGGAEIAKQMGIGRASVYRLLD